MKDGKKYWQSGAMIFSSRGLVCDLGAAYDQTRGEDGKLIVNALNGHEALVKLARQYRKEAIGQGAAVEDLTEIDEALKLAGEEP